MNAIDGWERTERRELIEARAARKRDPGYPAALAHARKKGFEPAPVEMLLDQGRLDEKHLWAGEVWVKSGGRHE